jgi:hypothetical protein
VPSVLADSVSFGEISALLAARELNEDTDGALIGVLKEGIAVEVAGLVGDDPADTVKERAMRAVAVGTAWQWERSMYPNQLQQDGSSAQALRDAYLGLREELKLYRANEDAAITSGPYLVSFW